MFYLLDKIDIEYLLAALILTLAFAAMLVHSVWSGRRGWLSSMRAIRLLPPLSRAELLAHIRAAAQKKTHTAKMQPITTACSRLRDSYKNAGAYAACQQLTPAGQWLCDNARILEEAAMTVLEAQKQSPSLPAGMAGVRVEEFARQLIMHTEGRVDAQLLKDAATAYSSECQFTEDELWALPLAVRRQLVMLAAKFAEKVVCDEKARAEATAWSDKIKKYSPANPPRIFRTAAGGAFIERILADMLEREDAEGLRRMDEYLAEKGTTAALAIEEEHTRQMRQRDIMGNAITSLKLIGYTDWHAACEELSAVHSRLMCDPSGVYAKMDYPSRAMYRSRVAQFALATEQSEAAVAERAVCIAKEHYAAAEERDEIAGHVGYYLVDDGQPQLWKTLGRGTFRLRVRRFFFRHAAAAIIVSLAILDAAILYAMHRLAMPWWSLPLALPVIGEASRAVVQACGLRMSHPKTFPRLAPDQIHTKTLVVVPTLLVNRKHALDMARHLSVLRFANPQRTLEYMLLGDFKDADTETTPEDREIIDAATEAVNALNQVWGGGYYYVQRGRTFNGGMGCYIGRERKRGALETLNSFLADGECECSLASSTVDPTTLKDRYAAVITLDSDTQLPPDAALTLAGAMAHPLVRPTVYNGRRRGHAILQPRMADSARAVKTRLQRLFGGEGGVDMYVSAANDFYQNIACAGSFCGKGIYDPVAFHEGVRGKIRPGTVLSHDLLEGGLTRGAMLCDIPLYDGQPSNVTGWYKRLHRWTRGDWQLLPWLFPLVRVANNAHMPNPLNTLSRYKIYDNMRRSLVPIAELVLILTGFATGSIPLLLTALIGSRVSFILNPSASGLKALLLRAALLPREAVVSFDAIARTLWRVLVSHKKTLEWTTAQQAEASADKDEKKSAMPYTHDLAAAVAVLGFSAFLHPWFLIAAIPLASAWLADRALEDWLAGGAYTKEALTHDQTEELNTLAMETWRYFADNVSRETNFLPPDNLQTEPPKGAAQRTSPTNIGMYLLSCAAARELALITDEECLTRIAETVAAVERLETWRGHLLNWYDTQKLHALRPKYVSAVDSGNFSLCCVAVAQAVRALLSPDSLHTGLPARLDAIVDRTEFGMLFDEEASLFYIGMDLENNSRGSAHYDLLASEARMLSFLTLMRRDAALKHWRALGRTMTAAAGNKGVLLSWAGTMFEYLMPSILLPSIPGTLLGDSNRNAVAAQIAFSRKNGGRKVDGFTPPWGISESGYAAFDPELNFQYKAFGLPELSLRGGMPPKVVSPYSAALALSAAPAEAARNLAQMRRMGWNDEYGMYEAVDFDAARIAPTRSYQIVKSHMSHHQGMILCSIANALLDDVLVKLLTRLPQVEAYEILLEEKALKGRALKPAVIPRAISIAAKKTSSARVVKPGSLPIQTHLLHGMGTTYMQDSRGNGYISHNGYMLTRWRSDPTLTENGLRLYMKLDDGEPFDINSAAPAITPVATTFDSGLITSSMVIAPNGTPAFECAVNRGVSALDGTVLFEVKLTNKAKQAREVMLASFCEVALSNQKADEAHPAFRDLFVETSRPSLKLLTAKRRPRGTNNAAPMLAHWVGFNSPANILAETEQSGFMKRDGSLPFLRGNTDGKIGAVVDPCMSLRASFSVPAEEERTILFCYAAVSNEAEAETLANRYVTADDSRRLFQLAVTQSEVSAAYLGLDGAGVSAAQTLSAFLLYNGQPIAGINDYIQKNTQGVSGLWQLSVSGDLPVLSAMFGSTSHVRLANSLLRMQDYLRRLGLWFDLVLIADEEAGYNQPVRDALREAVAASPARERAGVPSGVYIVACNEANQAAVNTALAFSSFVFYGEQGSVAAQLSKVRKNAGGADNVPRPALNEPRSYKRTRSRRHSFTAAAEPITASAVDIYENSAMRSQTVFGANGLGGYDADDAYIIQPGSLPPSPWCNVIVNPQIGGIWTDRGAAFMWSRNSGLSRMTRFDNDPLRGGTGEAVYIRDELTRAWCTPTPYPSGGAAKVKHAQGYTSYESNQLGLSIRMTVFADIEQPVICRRIEIKNTEKQSRSLTVTPFVKWSFPSESETRLLHTGVSEDTVWAKHPADRRTLFLKVIGEGVTVSSATTDALAFLGIGGIESPRAMEQTKLDGMGGRLPCAAITASMEIEPLGEIEVCVLTGAAGS